MDIKLNLVFCFKKNTHGFLHCSLDSLLLYTTKSICKTTTHTHSYVCAFCLFCSTFRNAILLKLLQLYVVNMHVYGVCPPAALALFNILLTALGLVYFYSNYKIILSVYTPKRPTEILNLHINLWITSKYSNISIFQIIQCININHAYFV